MIEPELDTFNVALENGLNLDSDGHAGPYANGVGPRRNPLGEFPSGPAVGTRLPAIRATDSTGAPFDVHEYRNGRPLAMVFFRSAVW